MLKNPVNGAELKSLRESLGLGQQGLAALLHLGKAKAADGRNVRRWEAGDLIQGPVQIIMRLLERGKITGAGSVNGQQVYDNGLGLWGYTEQYHPRTED